MRHLILAFTALFLASCHDSVEELTRLHGLTEAAVIADLGTPSQSNVQTLQYGATLPEFYIEVHNTYDPADPKIDGVEIKELRWDRSGFTEAVFLHKVDGIWTVLESCRWKDGVVF